MSDGFEEWYRDAHGRVLATLLLVTGSLDAAAEATDEAFCRAFDKWRTVSKTKSPVAWTIRVAINVARRRGRRGGLEARLLRRQPPPGVVPAPAGEAWDAVKDLPERQRQVLVLRYVADLSEAEIARILGVWALRRSRVWRSPELAVDAGGFRVGVGRLAVRVGGRDLEAVVFA